MLVAFTVYTPVTPAMPGAVKCIVCPSRVVCASSDPVLGSTLHLTPAESFVVTVSETFWPGVSDARRGATATCGAARAEPLGEDIES
jgi:hypothetical protein